MANARSWRSGVQRRVSARRADVSVRRVFPDGDGEDDADAQDGDDVRARNGARTLERGTDDATATAEEDARDDSARDGRSTMDSLAADNLRLRRENARLREDALEASRRE